MLAYLGRCAHGEFEFNEITACGHFSYNGGNQAFCNNTEAKRLNASERRRPARRCGSGAT